MRIPGIPYVQGRNSYDDRDDQKFGIAIHNTSNTAPASGEASYATRRTDGVSAHLYCDDREVIQSIDLLARTGHAGSGTGNENAISVELTGLNSWTRQQWIDRVAWPQLGAALRWCCDQFGIAVRRASVAEMRSNPKVKAFYSHDDMRQAWGGTDHTDPGPNFPWDVLFAHVAATPQEDDMALSDGDAQALIWRVAALVDNLDDVAGGPTAGQDNVLARTLKRLVADVADIKASQTSPAPVAVDAAAVAAALAGNEEFLGAVAKAVNDEAHARSAE